MGFQLCSAQEKTTESSDSSPNKNVVYFTAGAFQPLAFGDNMANKALDSQILGTEWDSIFRVLKPPLNPTLLQVLEITPKPK